MTQPARLSPAEVEERRRDLHRWGLDQPRASVTDIATRRPLGLAPIIDDEPERDGSPYDDDSGEPYGGYMHGPIVDCRETDQAVLDAAADHHFVYFALNVAAGLVLSAEKSLKEKIASSRSEVARVELENARLRASVGELTAKVESLTFISERMRIENAGPVGPQGLMGRDGHEGRPGARGERGAEGKPGRPAPTIVAWTLDEQAFTATPLLSDGRKGAILHLMPLFQSYTEQMEASDAAEEHDVVQAQRAVIEREAEARRLGLPAR